MADTSSNAASNDPKSREVRLGLVLYGGVSLAVYMNGVAHEFFNAVRGRGIYALIKALTDSDIIVDIISGASAGGINGIFLGYALSNEKEFGDFAQLWRNQGDVDLLLRKPGGAPETYLSLFDSEHYYQDRLHDAFRVVRDIDPGSVLEMPSGVLDGTGGPGNTPERPHVKELDLYIAGTNVGGNITTQIDDAGHAITVKDHRAVFILRHRRGRKSPFGPKDHPDVTFESLAKLSRITSAFPAAFSPVEIEGVAPDTVTVDGRLQRWGQIGVKAYFVDGGVLYNKPFGYTIKDIVFRLANIETQRFLLYVEPDPERFEEVLKEQQAGLGEAPNFFTDISDSLISLPGYQSIAGDLQDLTEQNSKVRRYQILTKTLQNRVWDASRAEREKDPGKQAQNADLQSVRPDSENAVGPAQEIHHRSRLLGLGERVIQGALRTSVGRNMSLTPVQARAAEALTSELFESLRTEKNQKSVLDNTDVYYRLRRTFHAAGLIRALLYKDRCVQPESAEGTRYLKLRYALNQQIDLLQIVQTVMEELIDIYPIIDWREIHPEDQISARTAGEVWTLAYSLLQKLLNTQGPPLADEQGQRYEQFLKGYTTAWGPEWKGKTLEDLEREWLPQPALTDAIVGLRSIRDLLTARRPAEVLEPQPSQSLLAAIDQVTWNAFLALTGPEDLVRVAYENFDSLDSVLYPIELAGDLQCKDVIQTVRVSPYDAQRGFSRKPLDQKVAGIGFHHFAAFFKRSWRSNDIMWGRLDGICQLAECLLKGDRLKQLLGDSNPDALERVQRRFGMFDAQGKFTGRIPQMDAGDPSRRFALHPDTLFPTNSPESRAALTRWLENLLSSDLQRRTEAINALPAETPGREEESVPGGPLELLIQLAQYEVIREALPQVAHDAAEEQLEWNCYPVAETQREAVQARSEKPLRFDLESATFHEGEGELEPTEITIAAAAAATLGIAAIEGKLPPVGNTPKETPLGRFFDASVGLRTTNLIDNLPPSVLVSIVVQALRVLDRCVLTALGATGQAIEQNVVFHRVIDWPLRTLYAWSQWWRRSPSSERSWRVTIWWVAVASLAIGILSRQRLIFTDRGLSLPWFIALLVLPLAVLLTMYSAGMKRRWTVIVLLTAIAGLSAGIVTAAAHWIRDHTQPGAAAWPWMDSALILAIVLTVAAVLGARWRRRPDSLSIVTPDVLKGGAVGQHYLQELMASGGVPPYHWSVVNGLPILSGAGLTVTVSGTVTGFPQKEGDYLFRLRVSDSCSKKKEQGFRMKIGPRAGAPASSVTP